METINLLKPKTYQYFLNYAKQFDDRNYEDVVQEALVRLLKRENTFGEVVGGKGEYIKKIILNVCKNNTRKRKGWIQLHTPDIYKRDYCEDATIEKIYTSEIYEFLFSIMKKRLSPLYFKTYLLMTRLRDNKEISKKLNIAINQVRAIKSQIRKIISKNEFIAILYSYDDWNIVKDQLQKVIKSNTEIKKLQKKRK